MSTLHELARATGLAVSTISEILRDKPGYQEATRQRVLAAAERLHYRPSMAARQLRSGRSGWLGVLMNLDDPGANLARLAGLERAALARGYRLVVGRLAAGESVTDFLARGLDGLFWLHPADLGREGLGAGTKLPRTLVALDQPLAPSGGCVRVDYPAGLLDLVRHLRQRGRQRIGFVGSNRGEIKLFQSFARAAGLKPWPSWELPAADQRPAGWAAWSKSSGVDAVVASRDAVAAEMLKLWRAQGLQVPGQIALAGWGDEPGGSWLDPALTTVDLQPEEWARAAMALMTRLVEGAALSARERTLTIAPRLVIRESS